MFELLFSKTLIIGLCMAGEAFFSGMETGVISIHRLRLQHFVRRGERRAQILQGFIDDTDRLLGTTLTGTNVCVVITSIVAGGLAFDLLGRWIGSWSQAVSSALCSFTLLVACEYLPKAWFYSHPFERCLRLAPLLAAAEKALKPLSTAVVFASRLLLPGRKRSLAVAERSVTKDELKMLVTQVQETGVLTRTERTMIQRVLDLPLCKARDIMAPRERLTFVYGDTTLDEFCAVARASGFMRMPVFDRAQNAFTGIVNVLQVVSASGPSPGSTIQAYARPLLLVAPEMSAAEILPRMRRLRQPLALVGHSPSDVIGLLTAEDIIQQIIGTS